MTFAPRAGGDQARDPRPVPRLLSQTGLYSDIRKKIIAPENLPYSPQYPLWSDGARKSRWVFIPPGQAIDGSDPERWDFPKGTKFFKEFSFRRRIETRLIERVEGGWAYGVYVWDPKQTDARLAPMGGFPDFYEYEPGLKYTVPGTADCEACHEGSPAFILGFSALQLSPDRDPGAPNLERVTPQMLNLRSLVEKSLIKEFPPKYLAPPPRIAARTPLERAALGYLHGNCGNCHNASGPLASLDLHLWHSLEAKTVFEEPALRTTLNRQGKWAIPELEPEGRELIAPGAPARSSMLARLASRSPYVQMPPLVTKRVDSVAVGVVERWIRELGPPMQPRRRTQ